MSWPEEKILEFEKFWNEKIVEIKNMSISKNDIKTQMLDFQIEKQSFLMKCGQVVYERDEIQPRLDRLEKNLDLALLQAKENYREKERIRIKEAYGPISELIFLLWTILGKYK